MKRIYLVTERKAQEFTQVTLAREVPCDQKTISRLETIPTARPSFDIQQRLGEILKVDPKTLAFGPDPRAQRKAS